MSYPLTERHLRDSAINLFTKIASREGPYRATFKYIIDNNSATKINEAIETLLKYLQKEGFIDQINNPNFFTENTFYKPVTGGMKGGMRISAIIGAVILTIQTVSGFGVGAALATFPSLTAFVPFAPILTPLSNLGFAAGTISGLYESIKSEVAKPEKFAALSAVAKTVVDEEVARFISSSTTSLTQAKKISTIDGDTIPQFTPSIIDVILFALAAVGLFVMFDRGKNYLTGTIPPVDFDKLRRTRTVLSFGLNSTNFVISPPFSTIDIAETASSVGYPLYELVINPDPSRPPGLRRIKTWTQLRQIFQNNGTVVTSNKDFRNAGGKRRSTRRR